MLLGIRRHREASARVLSVPGLTVKNHGSDPTFSSSCITLVRRPTALSTVLMVAGVIVHDRGGHGFLYLRDRRFRFHRVTVRADDVRGVISQVGGLRFVAGDQGLQELLGLGWVVRASVRPTCLCPAVAPEHEVSREQTLAELSAGLLLPQ